MQVVNLEGVIVSVSLRLILVISSCEWLKQSSTFTVFKGTFPCRPLRPPDSSGNVDATMWNPDFSRESGGRGGLHGY